MSSLRSKLEDFFTTKPSQQRQAARDIEDPSDPYSHVHKYFKPDRKTDGYAETVEVGERRIKG